MSCKKEKTDNFISRPKSQRGPYRDLGNSPQETKPRDSLGMGIVERPKCGSLVALQAWVLQRVARDGDERGRKK